MYCPRCGHQTTSEELRFCSYCGLKLAVVKAALADGEEVPPAVLSASRTSLPEPRQRDMSIGVFLMFLATLLASFLTTWPGLGVSRLTGAAILTTLYLTILVASGQITKAFHKLLSWEDSDAELASGQKGVGLGATLMFITSILIGVGSVFAFGRVKTTEFFVGLGLAFPFCLLLSHYLMRGPRSLIHGESKAATLSQDASAVQSLPPATTIPVSLFGTHKVQTAEIITPPSITEHTTNLLENK